MITRFFYAFALFSVSSIAAAAPIQFQDQSKAAGLTGHVESWGLTWTDINADGWPDLFIQGHRDFPQVYRNTGTGAFEDVATEYDPEQIWMNKTYDDKHAVTSADIDNDGDQDIMIAVSRSGPAQVLLNKQESGGKFEDAARSLGLNNNGAARMAIWFDYNNDGRLDVHSHDIDGTRLMRRSSWFFSFSRDGSTRCSGGGDYGQLMDVNNDGHLDYICGHQGDFPQRVFDYSRGNLYNYSRYRLDSLFPGVSNVVDSIPGDFNNDLKSDLILMRGALRGSGASKVNEREVHGWLRGSSNVGFSFTAQGQVRFLVDHHPMGVGADSLVVDLDTNGSTSASPGGVSIAYSSSTGKWTVKRGSPDRVYVRAISTGPIGDPDMVNIKNSELPTPMFHLVNGNSGFSIDHTTGIARAKSCVSGVAADFDNDMDLDVYMACRQGIDNLANRYFDNQGDGTFVEVVSHGGEGPVGAGLEIGVAESVAVADYDVDGFMDVAVTNGLMMHPFGKGGPHGLYRNKGNNNKWIQIDLSGVESNRDGIGAKVYATAGGVTQLREQNGGYHRWSQNAQRIHFGLASNNTVDITIEWPSGQVDTHTGVSANKLYRAEEDGDMTPVTLGPEVRTVVTAGDECGQPVYEKTYGPGITMWRDCGGNDEWQIRFNSGSLHNNVTMVSEGSIQGDSAFPYANGVALKSEDTLQLQSDNLLSFGISVRNGSSGEKGINLYTGSQATSCLDFTKQDISKVIVGRSQKLITAPFDLVTLSTNCVPYTGGGNGGGNGGGEPLLGACYAPSYDHRSEKGLFIWKACDGTDQWHIRVTAGGDPAGVDYRGVITSEGGVAYTEYNFEPNDSIDTSTPDTLEYLMRVWNNAQDGLDFTPAENACFSSSTLGIPVYLGQSRTEISGPLNLTTLEACTDEQPTPPTQSSQCGEPSYDNKSEPGFYVWKDCTVSGPDEMWYFRAVGGGLSWAPYTGVLTSSEPVIASGDQLEGNDIVDTVAGDGEVDFTLYVGGGGVDGVDIQLPATSDSCLDIMDLPSGSQIYVGAGKEPVTSPFNLKDLGACQ